MKWIHLNFGDLGVKALFLKAFESLDKNGLFIIEAQNWKSYKKKKNLTPELSDNYRKIQLRPKNFEEFLTKQVGFRLMDIIRKPHDAEKAEKDMNPLYVYQKP